MLIFPGLGAIIYARELTYVHVPALLMHSIKCRYINALAGCLPFCNNPIFVRYVVEYLMYVPVLTAATFM